MSSRDPFVLRGHITASPDESIAANAALLP